MSAATLRDFQRLKFSDSTKVAAHFFAAQPPASICQGDVFGPLALQWWGADNVRLEDETLAILISPSCDYDNDDFVLVAPVYEADRFKKQGYYSSMTQQGVASLYYLAAVPGRPALVADLNLVQSYPKPLIQSGFVTGTVKRVCSLSTLGWMGFMLKLTYLFARPEPADEQRGSSYELAVWDRFKYAFSELKRVTRYALLG